MLERILYTTLVDLSLPYGPGVNERGFVRDMLARYGDRFHAVVPKPARGLPEELVGLSATLIPSGSSVRTAAGWAQANSLGTIAVPRAIRRFRPDLVVMRTGAFVIPHYRVSRTTCLPYVVKTAGDVSFRAFYGRSRLRRRLRSLNDRMFERLLDGALCIDVVSSQQRDLVIQMHPDLESRVHVVENGVDLELFGTERRAASRQKLGFAASDLVVGYVGGLPMQRGGKEVVDVVAGLIERYRVRGLIVGDSGEADACRRYAESRSVSQDVVVYGEVDYGEVPDLMASMDVGISILRGRERENSEQKVRQYLATGLCVVGTAGSNDFLRGQDFARVVDGDHLEEIIDATTSLLDLGRDNLLRLGLTARRFAEANLSLARQNERRIELWNAMLVKRAADGLVGG